MESGWWTMTWTRKMAFKQITEHFVWVNMNFFILVLFMILIEENLYNGKLKDSLGSKAAGLVDGVPFCCSVVTSWAGYIRTHSQRTVPGSGVWAALAEFSVQPELRVLTSSSHLSAFLLLSVVIPSNCKSEVLGTTTFSLLGHPQRMPLKGRHMLVWLSQESLVL